jgi:hypothetical protein
MKQEFNVKLQKKVISFAKVFYILFSFKQCHDFIITTTTTMIMIPMMNMKKIIKIHEYS